MMLNAFRLVAHESFQSFLHVASAQSIAQICTGLSFFVDLEGLIISRLVILLFRYSILNIFVPSATYGNPILRGIFISILL